ncbi:uncharacterized protein At4g02000-like [Arachis hypogaea]|uniref:uncharacterized protein At4g02000-like n=1 Tax=Arachis hypogaea TaxID=3818 RepID=UPI000DEC6EA2|nr:uncharacterized protein At4g02000-like [Arachis hypogaea]
MAAPAASLPSDLSNPVSAGSEEETVVRFDNEDIQEGVEKCSKSLVDRLLADRGFSSGTLEAALTAIWRQPDGFKVLNHGGNIFQFFFDKEIDLIRVEKGAPWLFKNYILNLKRWEEDLQIKEEEFIHVPIWVQLWGVPEHCKTKNLGKKVGEALGKVLDVDLFTIRGKDERILKIQVLLDITKPLRRCLKIAGSNNKVTELKLRYERIGNFCHYCGYIGHEVRTCSNYLEDSVAGENREEMWGGMASG